MAWLKTFLFPLSYCFKLWEVVQPKLYPGLVCWVVFSVHTFKNYVFWIEVNNPWIKDLINKNQKAFFSYNQYHLPGNIRYSFLFRNSLTQKLLEAGSFFYTSLITRLFLTFFHWHLLLATWLDGSFSLSQYNLFLVVLSLFIICFS